MDAGVRPGLAAGRASLGVTVAIRGSRGLAGFRQDSRQTTGLEWKRRRGWRAEVTGSDGGGT